MRPIFIGGTGRCGTRAVRRALGRHPEISALPAEFRIFSDPGGLVDLYAALTHEWTPVRAGIALRVFAERCEAVTNGHYCRSRTFWHAVGGLEQWRAHCETLLTALSSYRGLGHWVDRSMTTNFFHGRYDATDPLEAINAWIRGLLPSEVWVDDTPCSPLRAPAITRMYPSAVFVWLQRDLRDVLGSMTQGRGTDVAGLRLSARRLTYTYRRFADMADEFLCYELSEVIAEPGRVLGEIVRAVGLEPVAGWKHGLNEDDAHLGRWTTDFTAEERAALPWFFGHAHP